MKFETEQDLFNHIVAHAASMDGPSMSGKYCVYRGHNGSMCLVGACISDEEYSPRIEGRDVWDLSRSGLLPSGLENYKNLLSVCQKSHDLLADSMYFDFSAELLEKLRIVAEEFNLDFVLPNKGDK